MNGESVTRNGKQFTVICEWQQWPLGFPQEKSLRNRLAATLARLLPRHRSYSALKELGLGERRAHGNLREPRSGYFPACRRRARYVEDVKH
jgi:hypothetical protein